MSCKCFEKRITFKPTDAFCIRLNASKCNCSSRFSVQENRSGFSILCKDRNLVDKYKIDGYFDSDTTHKKCDYLFIYYSKNKNNPNTIIFVELKGKDIEQAIKQLDTTISVFDKEQFFKGKNNSGLIGAIVSTGYPSDDATYRKLKKNIMQKFKKYNLQIERKTYHMRYDPKRNMCLGINEK
jgi:hypothetical protein